MQSLKRCRIAEAVYTEFKIPSGNRHFYITSMDKQIVSEKELLGWLNAELSKHDECDDCRFTSIMRLRGTDADGCNWSPPNLRCSGRPFDPCAAIANELVVQAHARFNLAAE